MLEAGDVVAARAMHLGERELRESDLAASAGCPCDAHGFFREALGVVTSIVVQESEREDPAGLRARAVALHRSLAIVGITHRFFCVRPCACEVAGIEGFTRLREGSRSNGHECPEM